MSKINILAYLENASDATSFYRGMGPLNDLIHSCPDINVAVINGQTAGNVDWDVLGGFSILFMQRPASHYAYTLATKAVICGMRVWVDFDDELTAVSKDNPTAEYYNSSNVKTIITQFIARKDFVKTVSTSFLKKQFESIGGENIHVVPNALNTRLMDRPDFKHDKWQADFTWRGSMTHEVDLAQWREAIHHIPSVEYFGYCPHFMFRDEDFFTKPLPILDYYYNLRYNNRNLFFVTLADTSFNRSKSNIAAIEAVWAGGVCLCPDWEEWSIPGCITYSSHQDFIEKAKMMMEWDIPTRKRHWIQASEYIMDNLQLKDINKKRYEIIQSLIS